MHDELRKQESRVQAHREVAKKEEEEVGHA